MYRAGFVSNSSSASFTIKVGNLSVDQLTSIKNALSDKRENIWGFVKLMGYLNLDYDWGDHWTVIMFDDKIIGDTSCNNGDIDKFFDELSIPREKVNFWDESDDPLLDEELEDED